MQSTYYVRRQHDGARMRLRTDAGEWIDCDNAIEFALQCVQGSLNTESYEVLRTKDDIMVATVGKDHGVRFG